MIITFDIETVPTAIDADWLQEQEAKLRDKYVKEATIQQHLAAAKDDWRWELGGCQPVAIALKRDDGSEWSMSGAVDDMLMGFFAEIAKGDGLKRLCGFNILAFDLPVLHVWASRLGLSMPFKLDNRSLVDLIHFPYGKAKHFGSASLNDYLRGFGIPAKTAHGSQVEEMWASDIKNKTEKVREYCLDDVRREAELLKRIQQFWVV